MPDLLTKVAAHYVKPNFTDVKSGDTVRVYTTVTEGSKTRTQYFEGLVIRRRGGVSPDASFTVRRIASGVGVERTFALHSPLITEIKILRGAKVRRAQLHYMRERAGKSARLKEQPVRQADRDTAHPWLKGTGEKGQAPLEAPVQQKAPAKTKAEKAEAKSAAGKSETAPAESKAKADQSDAKSSAPKAEAKKPDAKTDDAKSDDTKATKGDPKQADQK